MVPAGLLLSKRIFAIRFATCRITRNLPASGPLLMICHNRIAASQLIRSGLYHSWYKQVPTHCLLLCAIEAGDLLDSVKKIKYHEVPRMSIMSQGNFFYPFYGQKFYCSKTRKKALRTSDLLQSSKSLSLLAVIVSFGNQFIQRIRILPHFGINGFASWHRIYITFR